MRVLQMAPSFAYGDAISNDIIAIDKLIKKLGFQTGIFYEYVSSEALERISVHYKKTPRLKKEDMVIYHLSTSSPMAYYFAALECRKIVIYHNITPPGFFMGYNRILYEACGTALIEAEYLADKVDYCLADSPFNKKDLQDMGYDCNIDVLPILIPFDDYTRSPSGEVIRRYAGGKTNILFTGRVAPNKKIENVIRTFYKYQEYIDKNTRLFLVGSYADDPYYAQLRKYVYDLGIAGNVIFTGHVPFEELLAYYKLADVFLCMSEHEGFCVPLVEAMLFQKPIVAYNTTAVGYTLGGSGALLKSSDPLVAAMTIEKILGDSGLYEQIMAGQKRRLEDFHTEKVSRMFERYLTDFIEGTHVQNSAD